MEPPSVREPGSAPCCVGPPQELSTGNFSFPSTYIGTQQPHNYQPLHSYDHPGDPVFFNPALSQLSLGREVRSSTHFSWGKGSTGVWAEHNAARSVCLLSAKKASSRNYH